MDYKYYKINGYTFSQGELSFKNNEECNLILKENNIAIADLANIPFNVLIEKMYEGGVLKKIFDIILKQEKKFWQKKITGSEIIEQMTNSQIAEVCVDFFLFKSSWLDALITTAGKSNSMVLKAMVESQLNTTQNSPIQ